MRDKLQVTGIIFLLLGFAMLIGKCVPADPTTLPENAKGAYASVVTSGAFGNWGLVLIGIGCLCFMVRSFFRE